MNDQDFTIDSKADLIVKLYSIKKLQFGFNEIYRCLRTRTISEFF